MDFMLPPDEVLAPVISEIFSGDETLIVNFHRGWKVYPPGNHITYPPPSQFWRRVSFSQGGICYFFWRVLESGSDPSINQSVWILGVAVSRHLCDQKDPQWKGKLGAPESLRNLWNVWWWSACQIFSDLLICGLKLGLPKAINILKLSSCRG